MHGKPVDIHELLEQHERRIRALEPPRAEKGEGQDGGEDEEER